MPYLRRRQYKIMEAIGDGGLRHIIAKLTAVARYVGHIEHCIAFLEFRSPAVATNRLVGMHQQHRHTDLMPPRFQPALRTVDSPDPSGRDIGRTHELPISVEIPFAMTRIEQTFGICGAVALLHRHAGKQFSGSRHSRHSEFLDPPKVPVKKRTVEDKSLYHRVGMLRHVKRRSQPPCGMPHKHHLVDAVALHYRQSGINIGKILRHVAHLEGLLPRQQRASVLAQIHGIETQALVDHAVGPLLLEEIVIEPVHIQDSRVTAAIARRSPDHSRHHLARIVIGLIDCQPLVARKPIGNPLSYSRRHYAGRQQEKNHKTSRHKNRSQFISH